MIRPGFCSGGCGYPATRRLLLVGGIEPPEPVLVCEAAARNYGLHLTRLLPKPPALPTDPERAASPQAGRPVSRSGSVGSAGDWAPGELQEMWGK